MNYRTQLLTSYYPAIHDDYKCVFIYNYLVCTTNETHSINQDFRSLFEEAKKNQTMTQNQTKTREGK